MANKITDRNPSIAKLGIFIEEQETTSVESLCEGGTDHESLRTTGLLHHNISNIPVKLFTKCFILFCCP